MIPIRKQKKKLDSSSSKLILEEIIGLTSKTANGLASSICSSKCYYLAGCVVVVYDVDSGTRSHLIVTHRTPKPLNCVAVSQDGRFVAAGEAGNQPAVFVWDCKTLTFISELKGHLYGVECIAFSPDGNQIVSVGGYIYLWDSRTGTLITKVKATSTSSAVTSVSFSSDAKFVITAGKKHLKFWTVGFGSSLKTRSSKGTGSFAIHGKPVDLGLQKGSSFVSVISSPRIASGNVKSEQAVELLPIYALTDAGVLCHMHSGLSVKKSVDLKVEKGFALSASRKLIACACSNGVVQLFAIETLKYAATILYSEAKKCHDKTDKVSRLSATDLVSVPTFPDAVACQFLCAEKLVVVYGDHSLYVWDIRDVNKITRCSMLISHSACIWDIKNLCCGNLHDSSLACVARGCSGGVSFATCSADGTIRLWDIVLQLDSSEATMNSNSVFAEAVGTTHLVSAGIFERDVMETSVSTLGFRSLTVSQDGKYLAAGDCEGNLHIYDLHTFDYTVCKDAHDSEILSLSFSMSKIEDVGSIKVRDGPYFLASGGRDRVIHLYDVKRNFECVDSINDHSAAVTSVKLVCGGCKIISCSADRSLVFRDIATMDNDHKISRCHHQLASHGTVYDMAIDPTMEVVVTVGQDKKINTFDIEAGKLIRSFKQDIDIGDPIKVIFDPSCSYLVCSYSNRSICMFDFSSGDMVAHAMGHGEVVTGIIFLPDCKHIVSVGGDGCIFLWKVPSRLTSRMLQTVEECAGILSPNRMVQPVNFGQSKNWKKEGKREHSQSQHVFSPGTPSFTFSVSRLPKWAQAKLTGSDDVRTNQEKTLCQHQQELKHCLPLVNAAVEYISSCSEAQTPKLDFSCDESLLSTQATISPDTSNSETSSFPQEVVRSFDIDKRWLNVYTVCSNLANSPESQNMKDVKMSLSTSNTIEDIVEIQNDCTYLCADNGHGTDDGQVATSKKPACPNEIAIPGNNGDQFGMKGLIYNDAVVGEQLSFDKLKVLETMDSRACHTVSEESDLFKQYFGNLSEVNEIKREKSPQTLRRYSSQYVVRRDYFSESTKVFGTPVRNLQGNTVGLVAESATHVTVKDEPFQQGMDSANQEQKMTETLFSLSECVANKNLASSRLTVDTNGQEQIMECHGALRRLNTAAENLVQLFSKLEKEVPADQKSRDQLYYEAAQLLPSVAQKLSSVADLALLSRTMS